MQKNEIGDGSFRVRCRDPWCSFYIQMQLINKRRDIYGIEYNGANFLEIGLLGKR